MQSIQFFGGKPFECFLSCEAGPTRKTTTDETVGMWGPAAGRDGSFSSNLHSIAEKSLNDT